MGVWRWGKREIIHLSLHCHHQNDSCNKTGSDAESHFNVSLIVRDNVTNKTVSMHRPQLLKRKDSRSGFEPRSFCLPAQRLTAGPDPLTRRGRLGREIVFVTNLPPRLTPALRPDPPTVFLLVRLKHPQTDYHCAARCHTTKAVIIRVSTPLKTRLLGGICHPACIT